MEYKIKELCNNLDIGVSKFYKLKDVLEHSIPEQNRMEYFYNKGRNFYITEKGFTWFKENISINNTTKSSNNNNSSDIILYQNQIIEMYKNTIKSQEQTINYLQNENKRLLDIVSVKEQKDLAKDIKILGTEENNNFFSKIFNKFKNKQ